jgi:predicted nucleic acid-binding protein
MRDTFWDTWAWWALADRGDEGHAAAAEIARALRKDRWRAVTSDYVLDETLTGVRARCGHREALLLADRLAVIQEAGDLVLQRIDAKRFERALALFKRLDGKLPRLSLTDCTSLVVMIELRIRSAFTADPHFDLLAPKTRTLLCRTGPGAYARRDPA